MVVGPSVRYWRTPWGLITPATEEVANKHRLELVGWSAYTEERRRSGRISPGAIILMHDGIGPGAALSLHEERADG
jgi:peptidoglycan/xylan/chitin deacetylase (PgdA/CDA1 family)